MDPGPFGQDGTRYLRVDPPMSFACAPRSIRLLSFEALFARICLTGVFPLRSL